MIEKNWQSSLRVGLQGVQGGYLGAKPAHMFSLIYTINFITLQMTYLTNAFCSVRKDFYLDLTTNISL